MIEVPLTQGFVAIVDDRDAWVLKHKWCALQVPGKVYAKRTVRVGPRRLGKTKTLLLHREILGLRSKQEADHRNGDGLNNQRKNLRVCSKSGNAANRPKCSTRTSSRFKGVSWSKRDKRWVARITVDGLCKNLGSFKVEKSAALAYDVAARVHFGKFASLNGV